ncbi:MAG: 1-acyl-sn-glycerol-3-phosphate acyltransferase [Clostridia bacterium]|nr:1-acyl-sn-glycerol-3-phosphate acyltransferase [Clostridia bacterium]
MKRSPLYVIGRLLLIPIFKLLFFYKVNGKENVPDEGSYIICSNHMSNYDPVLLAITQKRQINYMAKAELFKNPFFGWIIRHLGAFPVHRGAGDGKAINEAENVLKEGKILGIFIEGTRSKTGEFLRPKSGAAIIAQKMNVPVIPVCITPKNKKITIFQRVTISWGRPITPEQLNLGNGGGEAYRAASRQIMGEIKKLRENDLK